MSNYPGFGAAYVSKDPGFSKLKKLASESSDTEAREDLVTEVLYDPLKPIKAFGTTVYIRHKNSIRTATANAVRIGDQVRLQTIYHAFVCHNIGDESEDDSDDDAFEIDSDWGGESWDESEADVDLTSIGSQSPDNCSESGSSDNEYSRSSTFSNDYKTIFDDPELSSSGDQFLQDSYHKIMPGVVHRPTYTPNKSSNPSVDSLLPLGTLVEWSADNDWALVEVTAPEVEQTFSLEPGGCSLDTLAFDNIAPVVTEDAEIIAHTTSGGVVTGTLSGTPSSMRISASTTFQEVYTIILRGPLANGDCGSLVIDANTEQLYGYIVAGCETTGSAYVLAASAVTVPYPVDAGQILG
ncbi:hypothetical protein P154DRAFT_586790 [Amniculicola lignicola CBS 123094]|uniref:Uncharacterized protein n=1 Tax=Amniculicola lignicola CBS 123094 TaxID=1392246 RepID=A0A6A5VZI4_9PLEO|nr:hypothetical protein P154DRAFT_586790 [Amniculicola lignicola CBS 123094]